MDSKSHDGLVLLVEDNPTDEMLAIRALNRAQIRCEIEIVRDGAEALERLADTNRPVPDLVLLDLKLPKIPGHEVLVHIRGLEHTKNVPVVCLTSSDEHVDILKAYEKGANSYIRKPTEFREYMDKIGMAAAYWLNVNEPCA